MGGILCGLKIIRLITPNQNEYVWYRSLIPGSATFWYGSGSAIRTLIRRVSDPDPHGSAFIWAAGSGSAYKLRIRIRIKSMQIRNHADRDPEHCSFRYGTYRIVPILCIATGTVKCPYFGHHFDFATFFHSQKKFCSHYLLHTKHVWRSALGT